MQYVALNQKRGKYLQLYAEVNLKKQKQKTITQRRKKNKYQGKKWL